MDGQQVNKEYKPYNTTGNKVILFSNLCFLLLM